MNPDLWSLYAQMFNSRLFESVVEGLWHEGLISGEMHLGTGEEGIVAGVLDHLVDGDAVALDHRGTPPMLMRGMDPVLLLREFLGREDGLCAGRGGHMHLFSCQHLMASSGIVGASGPAAAGFALANLHLRPGTVAVAFFGEGAMNQGMLLESINLAVAWMLPVLFVCKDNSWAITTPSGTVIKASLVERARGFGLPAVDVDGANVEDVWAAAHTAIERARTGGGPTFLHASCIHLEGHYLGMQTLRLARNPLKELPPVVPPLVKALLSRHGTNIKERFSNLTLINKISLQGFQESRSKEDDPVQRTRLKLQEEDKPRLLALEEQVSQSVQAVLHKAMQSS